MLETIIWDEQKIKDFPELIIAKVFKGLFNHPSKIL